MRKSESVKDDYTCYAELHSTGLGFDKVIVTGSVILKWC